MIDFNKLGIGTITKQIDPRDIFMGLTEKDEKFQYPRDVQGEVWKQWFEDRNNQDNIIKMNTGSGKTVVALMILQSCLNEGFGPALYVVPDAYLVSQVIKQAELLGIKVTDTERDYDYQRKKAILVVNIQKLINGKSVFGMRESDNYPIGSVIIDDIHACMVTIQEQFSITIPRENGNVYMDLIKLFHQSLNEQAEGRLLDMLTGRNIYENLLVPFWEWQDKEKEVYKILAMNAELEYLKFNFDLVKDVLKLSHCYISHNKIQIIPNSIPIHKIESFEDAKRRIYLSATLPDDSPFATLLGVDFDKVNKIISPEKANDIGERLILTPRIINKDILDEDVRYKLVEMSKLYNVVVIVPSFSVANFWESAGAVVLSKENIVSGIQKLKVQEQGLTVIVNRYDGIDLPDNACRILVIDGLPNTSNLNDIYEEEVVRKSERIQQEQIQRIEQGMGRGVRANSDYCLVFLLGNKLTDMLYLDDGFEYFSKATKEQFILSEKMCEQIEGSEIDDIAQICDYILKRDKQWVQLCKNVTSNVSYPKTPNVKSFSLALRKAFDYAEIGEYKKAVAELNTEINKLQDKRLRGYYKQLMAEYVNLYDRHEAQQILKSAKNENREILKPIEGVQFEKIIAKVSDQSRNVVDYIINGEYDNNKYLHTINSILEDLKFEEGTSKKFENAIADIFNSLGFVANQPEREIGKGPDNFVALGENNYLVIECKNETITDSICKADCNQLNGSFIWFNNLYKDEGAKGVPIMIHNSNIFEYACSPNKNIRIITPQLLDKLKKNIHGFTIACSQAENFKISENVSKLLAQYKLRTFDIIENYTVGFKIRGK